MLGKEYFLGQKSFFRQTLDELKIDTYEEFLDYLRKTYSPTKKISSQAVVDWPQSLITCEPFAADDTLFYIKDHIQGQDHIQCRCKTYVSAAEVAMLIGKRCFWCNYILQKTDFLPAPPVLSVSVQMRNAIQRATQSASACDSFDMDLGPLCGMCGEKHYSAECKIKAFKEAPRAAVQVSPQVAARVAPQVAARVAPQVAARVVPQVAAPQIEASQEPFNLSECFNLWD